MPRYKVCFSRGKRNIEAFRANLPSCNKSPSVSSEDGSLKHRRIPVEELGGFGPAELGSPITALLDVQVAVKVPWRFSYALSSLALMVQSTLRHRLEVWALLVYGILDVHKHIEGFQIRGSF